jgi:hypothetical protein
MATYLGLTHPNTSYLCAASSRDMIEERVRGTTWVTFTPNDGEEPYITRDYYFRYFPGGIDLEDIALYNVKDLAWEHDDMEREYRYFFFDFPWVKRDGISMPRDGLIVWIPHVIHPFDFDIDWLLSPYVDPESLSLKKPRNCLTRPREEAETNERNVRARVEDDNNGEETETEDEDLDDDADAIFEDLTNRAVVLYEERMQNVINIEDDSDDDTVIDF